MRSFLVWSVVLGLAGALGCTRGPTTAADSGAMPDVGARDVGNDAATVSCTSDADCNDAIPCTFDQCVVGNVCDHVPLDAMCTGGQRCDVVMGCSDGCDVAAECDDGDFCNGTEHCVAHACYHDEDRNCDDGRSCTTDSCDPTAGACAYTTVCDAGVVPVDAGPACTPFEAPADFAGMYLLAPSQNQGCGVTMYTVSSVTVTATGSTVSVSGLRVDGTPRTMTGTSSGTSFTATYADSCGTYTLTGDFSECRETFDGHWTATFSGSCGICTNMDADIAGLRR